VLGGAHRGDQIASRAQPGDLVLVSLHWGPNWGYEIPAEWRRFAHALVAEAAVHVVHGHSSHHPKAVEVHAGQPILYGCGDFINDYEGIGGYEAFRSELVLGYFLDLDDATGALARLEAVPFRLRRLRLERAARPDVAWLAANLGRQCRPLGVTLEHSQADTLVLGW
jgi:poly-gamma-glutamate capsule biosynthesis protein CapA/YwtB (metallophosphatase superfamily)